MRKILLLFLIGLCQFLLINPAVAQQKNFNTPQNQYKYEQKVLRQEEIEKYERSLLPQSGLMTVEEYENLSKDIPNADKVIQPYKPPRDIKMKYVPQPTYKLVRYNDPPGSAELKLSRKFKFDRQQNCTAITSPNMDLMVYPVVYYYALNQCTASDLFVIPLDKSLPDLDRVLRANIIKRIQTPILSTPKEIRERFTFRTLTPVDFSPDGTKLAVKEKIGNVNDGIWKTNLWVYDFMTNQARELPEIRDAIKFYWMNTNGIMLDEKRWDITPLGFDANDPERIVVNAYGFTGKAPKFLGTWSIDYKGENTQLVSLFEPKANISMSGFKAVPSGVVDPAKIMADEKQEDKQLKQKKKQEAKDKKNDIKKKKAALQKRLKEMQKVEQEGLQQYNQQMNKSGITGAN